MNALTFGSDGALWVGTYDQGLNRFDPATGRAVRFRHDPGRPDGIGSDRIRTLATGHDGSIWVGLSGAGLDRLDPATGRFRHYPPGAAEDGALPGGFVRGLRVARDGTLWVATYGAGAARYDEATDRFVRYAHDEDDPSSLGSDFVRSVFEDSRGRIWFATDTGLNLLEDAERGVFRRWGVDEGLPNPVVYGVLEDGEGGLWMSTNQGLARLAPDLTSFSSYDVSDGLQGNEFNTGAFYRDAGGAMYFGGVDGLTVFRPEAIRSDPFAPPVRLTDFLLYNEPVPVSDSSVLTVAPPLVRSITLPRDAQVLTFEFAGLAFRDPLRNRYEYRLDGLHDGWLRAAPENRRATFTSLQPGTYTFRVRAANADGVWSDDEANVTLTVLPAFWETVWFRALVLLSLVGIGAGVMGLRQYELARRNRELERRVEERVAHIKRLEGLLPICSSCKKIRTTPDDSQDPSAWMPIESYITHRTDADFSHGFCPDCATTLMNEADVGR